MIILEDKFGNVKKSPIGFSWTTLFFGFWVPLFRGDFKWFLIMIIVGSLTVGVSVLVFPFFYNKLYYQDLINNGFERK